MKNQELINYLMTQPLDSEMEMMIVTENGTEITSKNIDGAIYSVTTGTLTLKCVKE